MGRKHGKNKEKTAKKRRGEERADDRRGKLEITRSGMGFVIVEGEEADILIRPSDFNTAMHGDTVRVRIKEDRGGRRKQGVIVGVDERKQSEFIGHLEMNKGFAFFVSESDKRTPDIYVPEKAFNGAVEGDRVVVRVKEWDNEGGKRPVGEVVSILNAEDVNDMAMKEILLEAGFPIEFPDDAMEEASRIPDIITDEEIKKRRDFRDILTF
ncbi:MAG TPA: ribonuclease R, partial [Flavisolibacter sp.]|nr:ribonuclease R [Flavisolibacter sp.]